MTNSRSEPTIEAASTFLSEAFKPRRAVARVIDHGELVQLTLFADDGTVLLEVDPIPREQIDSWSNLEVVVARIRAHLDEA